MAEIAWSCLNVECFTIRNADYLCFGYGGCFCLYGCSNGISKTLGIRYFWRIIGVFCWFNRWRHTARCVIKPPPCVLARRFKLFLFDCCDFSYGSSFYYGFEKLDKVIRWFDALGLAAFTVIGIEAALSKSMQMPIVVMMGVMTAVAGGIMRDVLCRQLPLLLHKEIYITASLIGSVFYLVLLHFEVSLWLRDVTTLLLIFAIRMFAVYRQWNLPNITLPVYR